MPVLRVDSLTDPRLDHYRDLKDRELAKLGGFFIAEGEHLVRRLLASDFPVESVLLAERRVEELSPLVPEGVPIYAAADDAVNGVVGFKFHSGVLACGRRKPSPRLEEIVPAPGDASRPVTLLVCPEIINADNLGSLVRVAAGLGADAMLLGERSCDPFWRRSVRVSMGTIFRLPVLRSDDLRRDLLRLKDEWRVEMVATVLDDSAEPLAVSRRPGPHHLDRLGLLVGSESQGLHRHFLAVCDRRVTIPMRLGTDSLNVAVAAGIFLHHFVNAVKQ